MRKPMLHLLVLAAFCFGGSAMAAEFAVLAATGVVEPEGLETGATLDQGAVVRLEPWGRLVLREPEGCKLTQVIVGAPEHRVVAAEQCDLVAAPGEVAAMLQQGAAFAANLAPGEAVDGLVESIAREPCVFLARVSEEGSNARRCPSGYALRAFRCSGEHCKYKDLLCCPYLGGDPDPDAKELASRPISEEFPHTIQNKKGFVDGLACNGPYCDNILAYQFRSDRLENTKQCDWGPSNLASPGQWLDCGDGNLVAGFRCKADYCGELSALCCGARASTP